MKRLAQHLACGGFLITVALVNIVVITVIWGLNCEGEGCGRVVFSPVSNWEGDGTTHRRGSREGGLCFLAPGRFPVVLKCRSFILYSELSIAFSQASHKCLSVVYSWVPRCI